MRFHRRGFITAAAASFALLRTARASDFRVVVYGLTPGGISAAIQAKRMGSEVLLVGGWREIHLGGMMSGGLGGTDLDNPRALTGIGREVFNRINQLAAQPSDTIRFEPRFAQKAFEQMVQDHNIPVLLTTGVVRVRKNGTSIESFITRDGKEIAGSVFIDASYEGDLMALSGISYAVGRGASNSENEFDGFRGYTHEAWGDKHNFKLHRRYEWLPQQGYVDPYRVKGDPGSGLLPGIGDASTTPIGSADKAVQAYNFRLTMTQNPERRIDLPDTQPAGFRSEDYELLFRWVETIGESGQLEDPVWSVRQNLLLHNEIGEKLYDINNNGAVSTDFIGGSWTYPEADYGEREIIWKRHENWIRGWFFALQHHPDARVPEALRENLRSYGWDRLHYLDPHPNDERHWSYCLYVREARRLVSDFVMNGSDTLGIEGKSKRSDKTIARGSYARDSHHVQRLVSPSAWGLPGSPTSAWNEGNFFANAGGPTGIFEIPLDVTIPRRVECSNLLVTFCVSATHEAFGAIRMEPTHLQIGQAAGAIAALASDGRHPVQDVPYDAIASIIA